MFARISAVLLGAALLTSAAAPAQAWFKHKHKAEPVGPAWTHEPRHSVARGVRIYAYPTASNYCPAGLQPVTINGVICCGVPTASGTYYNAPGVRRAPPPRGTFVATGKGMNDGFIAYDKSWPNN
jgi:hypothetical protein